MLNTQQAVIKYLEDGTAANFSSVRTIKVYRGEIARAAIQEEKVRKFADPLPAVYVTMIDGHPVSNIPEKQFDLLVITESRVFNVEKKEADNLLIIDGITKYIKNTPEWYYNNIQQQIDPEKVKVKTLLSDSRFIIIAISLYIKNFNNDI